MEDLIRVIDDLVDNAGITKNFLQKAEKAEKMAIDAIQLARQSIVSLESVENSDRDYELTLSQTRIEAQYITQAAIQDAVATNIEYAYLPFLIPLLDVAKKEELYEITSSGAGWNRSIVVRLRMDEVAGTIDDYAKAVDMAREEMGAKEGRDPARASKIWRTKIWPTRGGRGPYQHVISSRLSNLSSEAPYWSLLNNGNKSVGMSSDIGGTPYPSGKGTHFVEDAQQNIRAFFKEIFSDFREFNNRQIREMKALVQNYEAALLRLREAIASIVLDIEKAQKIEARLVTKTLDDIDPAKLLQAIEAQKAGKLSRRINVGRAGSRVRLSPSTLALYGD